MELSAEVRQRLETLNGELLNEPDSPVVKYFALQADYDFDGEWIALITLQLEEPEDRDEAWPHAQLERLRDRVWDAVGDIVTPDCLFRTPEEMREIEHQRGEDLSADPPPRSRRASGLAR
ncbi:hypothetical protein [Candidatus Poriferisodalis sp.]|uniref:hypothetical protein n=1 Tax=Candidatus Poriferisodalis sp. TaxID=3101277 RepID=UPI003B02A59C